MKNSLLIVANLSVRAAVSQRSGASGPCSYGPYRAEAHKDRETALHLVKDDVPIWGRAIELEGQPIIVAQREDVKVESGKVIDIGDVKSEDVPEKKTKPTEPRP